MITIETDLLKVWPVISDVTRIVLKFMTGNEPAMQADMVSECSRWATSGLLIVLFLSE